MFGALAEFERDLMRERTQAGLAAPRARGRKGVRPRALTGDKPRMAKALAANRSATIGEICRTLGVSRATYYRALGMNR